MARPPIFSFVNEQRRFLFLLIGFLVFLAVVASGIILSLSGAIGRFSSNLEKTGIIQILPGASVEAAQKIVAANKSEIVSAKTIDKTESAKLLQNYLKGGDAILGYIPTVIQVRAASAGALDKVAKECAAAKLRFAYGKSAAPDRTVGMKIMALAIFLFIAVLVALAACMIYSVKNIIIIHRREIEILHQVGSTNDYIAGQIQIAMLGISAKASAVGILAGWVVLFAANGLSRQAHVGLLANMGMGGTDWAITFMLAFLSAVMTIAITRRAALKILG